MYQEQQNKTEDTLVFYTWLWPLIYTTLDCDWPVGVCSVCTVCLACLHVLAVLFYQHLE